jgi:transposase
MANGKKQLKTVYEKQVVFWSRKYLLKARAERAEVIAKAEALVKEPKKYNRATAYGAAAYVSNLEFDKTTGEIETKGRSLSLDREKIFQEEMLDGYYAITTSEHEMSDWDIIDTYRGLWEIEETFKVTKSELEARPVYVSSEDHIDAHFLTCFLALAIIRIMQKQTGKNYSAEEIIDCLNRIQCMHESENIYLFGYRSTISDALGTAFGIDFSRKRLALTEIKKILADVKK